MQKGSQLWLAVCRQCRFPRQADKQGGEPKWQRSQRTHHRGGRGARDEDGGWVEWASECCGGADGGDPEADRLLQAAALSDCSQP